MRKYSLVILILVSFLFFNACKKDTTAIVYWQENIGSNKTLPLLPDSNVNYFLYSFARKKANRLVFALKVNMAMRAT